MVRAGGAGGAAHLLGPAGQPAEIRPGLLCPEVDGLVGFIGKQEIGQAISIQIDKPDSTVRGLP